VLALGALEGDGAVVPNDISVSAGRGLVLSGPNAGGKTVALKVLGLTALMVRAGIPILVSESSRVGYFDLVLTDVGDDQSLARNLSTFSAHVSNLASILDAASRGSLVLLDEVATGTDPEEGAALACAVVDVLCRRGAAVAVTTHYEALKALALRDERLRNASVGFDVARLAPTFELAMDVPGASSALLVAGRFGIPDEVIAIARRVLPEQSRTFDELVRQLEAQRQAHSIAEARLDAERRDLEAERGRLEQARAEQQLRERRQVSEETDRLLARIRTTRERVQGVQKALRERRIEEDQIREARRVLDQAASDAMRIADDVSPEVRAEAPDAHRPAASDLTTGRSVWVDRLRTRGTVVEPPERGKVRVATGAVKLVVGLDELRLLDTEPPPAPAAARAGPSGDRGAKAPAAAPVHVRTSDNTLDVRGLRVDEAVSMAESFVDRLYGRSEPVAFIVHGLGTGALREAIRAHFVSGTLYPVTARAGSRAEGGDGVTVVELA
jgi:DNA mismatch repair protein MutS2